MRCLTWSGVNMLTLVGGGDSRGGVWGGVDRVDFVETCLEREVVEECEAVDAF
jgi:hypothetical protein